MKVTFSDFLNSKDNKVFWMLAHLADERDSSLASCEFRRETEGGRDDILLSRYNHIFASTEILNETDL